MASHDYRDMQLHLENHILSIHCSVDLLARNGGRQVGISYVESTSWTDVALPVNCMWWIVMPGVYNVVE
jgi:hypothetical protein